MVYVAEIPEKKMSTSVKILRDAKSSLDALVRDRGIGKIELVSRMIRWLSLQDKTLQAVILGQVEPMDELAVLDIIRNKLLPKSSKSKSEQVFDSLHELISHAHDSGILIPDKQVQTLLDELRSQLGPDKKDAVRQKKA